MPVGLPQVSSTQEQIRHIAAEAISAWHDFVVYLDLPSASLYRTSCSTAWYDLRAAFSSLGYLGYLTFRPLVLILWLLSQYLWRVLQFLAKHLFHHAYVSAGKGWVQLKYGAKAFMKWQSTLSRTAVLMEISIVAGLIGCYMLRRYIQRKKYVQRTTSWYRQKKRAVKESYRRGVRRIAETSQLLAMLMPHAVFLASVASFKLLVPRLLTYLATDTYTTSVLSFYYPMVWTVALLHQHRNGSPSDKTLNETETKKVLKTPRRSNIFPRTTPSRSVQRWLRQATTPIRRATRENDTYYIHEEAAYWLQYWVVYTLVLVICRLTYLLPIVGRIITKYAVLSTVLRELQLVFFLWLFGVPMVTPELTHETRPIPLLYQRAVPIVTGVYNVVSTAIPENLWQTVVQTISSVVELAVLIKLISTETKEWLVHVLEESRQLLPPAVTLLMPGFLTEYGVLYVQTLVPCAKGCNSVTLDDTTAWLEYWVLHGLLSSLLMWWAPLLWWIPFSTHLTFLLWCNLQLPKITRKWYNIFEEELQAFGLLEMGDKNLQVERTITASMLRTLASSLPSGVQDEAEPFEAKQPDEATMAKPDEATLAMPDEATTLAIPDEATLAMPDEATSDIEICDETVTVAAAKRTRRRVNERSNSGDRSYSSSDTSGENEGSTITRRRSTRRRTQRTVN